MRGLKGAGVKTMDYRDEVWNVVRRASRNGIILERKHRFAYPGLLFVACHLEELGIAKIGAAGRLSDK